MKHRNRVSSSSGDQKVTIGVSRSGIHAMGSNGWDLLLWLISWMRRAITRDHRWVVTIRLGVPELMSGTQPLLYSEICSEYEQAVERVDAIAGQLHSGFEIPHLRSPNQN
ncbi:hypothetical protein IMCC26207_1054 [Actinobacteria bacterium IMCC26207]|nr:hypothetical protein IMCC26207_1054 [Actinobacteria bacterium IMCC26207]